MTVSKKSHQNLSEYIQFLFKKRFEIDNKEIISSGKIRNEKLVSLIYSYNRIPSIFTSLKCAYNIYI